MNKQLLYKEYIINKKSTIQIAKELGYKSASTIFYYLNKYKIKRRSRQEILKKYNIKGHIPWNKGLHGVQKAWNEGKHWDKKIRDKMRRNHWSRTDSERFKIINDKTRPRNPTNFENIFSLELLKRNYKFIRQFKVGTYCCDFYLILQNLIVEIDGYEKTKKRKQFIKNRGYNLLHIRNEELNNMNNVFNKIKDCLERE